jgi:uncharacterized protein
MAMALQRTRPAPSPSSATARRPRSGHRRPLAFAAGLGGLGLAVLAGVDGSPAWRALRVVVVALATVPLALALGRRSSPRPAVFAALVGVPAIAVAVGFAPHWVKGGPAPMQLAAAALAVGGVILAVGGVAGATEGRRWWTRFGAGLTLFAVVALAALLLGVTVAATNVPRPAIRATPASVGLEYRNVTLPTADGVELAGWYVPSTNAAAVVLLHGAGSTRSNVLDQAAVLSRAGFGVLLVDARGHGESQGRAMDFGWFGDADVAAATSFLARQGDVAPGAIGVVGLSMGGEEAIGAAATNAAVRAVVAEGATARNAADHAWLSDRYGFRGAVQEQLQKVQDAFTDLLTSASVPTGLRAAVESADDTPFLLITAGTVAEEGDAAAHLAAGAPDRVDVWTVAGAGHTDGLAVDPDGWRDHVISFLTTHLVGGEEGR